MNDNMGSNCCKVILLNIFVSLKIITSLNKYANNSSFGSLLLSPR